MLTLSRRRFFDLAKTTIGAVGVLAGSSGRDAKAAPQLEKGKSAYHLHQPTLLEMFLAVDNVCPYASLTRASSGDLLAFGFDRPTHGGSKGSIACWASEDGGRFWNKRSVAVPYRPGRSYVHSASGTAHDGSTIVVAENTEYENDRVRMRLLPPAVSRSSDGGRTWNRSATVRLPEGIDGLIPYGNIVQGVGKTLAAPCFEIRWQRELKRKSPPFPTSEVSESAQYLLFSHDDGRTWDDLVEIAGRGELTPYGYMLGTALRTGPNRWIAALDSVLNGVHLYVSDNEGRDWRAEGPLTLMGQRPGQLLKLSNGRLLLTYAMRERGHFGHPNDLPYYADGPWFRARARGTFKEEELPPRESGKNLTGYVGSSHGPGCLAFRVSHDEGRSWDYPRVLFHLAENPDGSYPATAQLDDGTLVTVYHARRSPTHHRFHMGAMRWDLKNYF